MLQLRGPMAFRVQSWWLFIPGDTLCQHPMRTGHMTVLQSCGLMEFRALQWCHPMLASTRRTSCCTRMITLYGAQKWIQARTGIIERSISPWASPIVIVPKKSAPGKPPRRRMCIDYRRINKLQPEVTKADGGKGCISLIPLLKIDKFYAKLKGYKVLSSFDLSSGYYHICLTDSAKPNSAFVLSSLGKYQSNRVPFGLAQAPAYFQKLINDVLKGCKFAMGYLDDIIIYSRSEKEHLEHLEEIFIRLKAVGLKLKLEKCCFFKKHIKYLGHLISEEGIQPLPEKLESIVKMPAPKNPKEVKQFLGLVGYYRNFIPRFADISRVLTHLTKTDVEFK